MIKKFFLILSLITIISCDYSPLYSTKNSKFLNIEIIEYKGDSKINSILRSRLKNHKNINQKTIKIKIKTEYIKKDLSRDTSGNISVYQLLVGSEFFINFGNEQKTISIAKNRKMEKFSDKFEENDYENRLKESMANSIYENLVFQLSNYQ